MNLSDSFWCRRYPLNVFPDPFSTQAVPVDTNGDHTPQPFTENAPQTTNHFGGGNFQESGSCCHVPWHPATH